MSEFPTPKPAPSPISINDSVNMATALERDNAYEQFQISLQADRIAELVETNGLNNESGFSIDTLRDSFKRYEFDLAENQSLDQSQVSKGNMTAGLIGVVSQTAYESALTQPNGSYKQQEDKTADDLALEQRVGNEVESIIEATYNDPKANPLKQELGGYLDIKLAQEGLANGRAPEGDYFHDDIALRDQSIIVNGVSNLDPTVRQLAAQSIKQAANNASHSPILGGEKTRQPSYVKSVIHDQISAYDDFEKATIKPFAAHRHIDALDDGMYNAKGAQLFLESRNNPTLASNNPVKQITADLDDPFSKAMGKGINLTMDKLHTLSQDPHTKMGDFHINQTAQDLLLNVSTLHDLMLEKLDNPHREHDADIELYEGYEQSQELVEQVRELAEELPERDDELEQEAKRVSDKMNEPSGDFYDRYKDAVDGKRNDEAGNNRDRDRARESSNDYVSSPSVPSPPTPYDRPSSPSPTRR